MYLTGKVHFLFALVLIGQHNADGLRCYKCSSLLDSRCHKDWDLADSDAEKFKVDCPPSAKACQKIIGEIQGSGAQHVYRHCWNHTLMENYIPTGCEEDEIRGSVVCRCTSELCNGQRSLTTSSVIYLTLLICGQLLQQLNLIKLVSFEHTFGANF